VLRVRYDGPDLAEAGRLTGLGADGLVEAHRAARWRVAFTGFAPGFGYLVGGDDRLRVPRRDRPRTRVPAGSVGLGGAYCGIYPRDSPGGWQLIGRTDTAVWDADRDPPALLVPGAYVRFEPEPGDGR
jgi:KipI family sensor histidine kinase inhibitor